MITRKKKIKLKYKNIFILILIIITPILLINILLNDKKEIVKVTNKPQKQITKKIKTKEINKLNYENSKEIKEEIINNLDSDPSIVIIDSEGNVLANRKENDRREGASTTKIFVGYAAIKLLDAKKDIIIGSDYSLKECNPYCNNKIEVGEELDIKEAATYVFPDSANSVATDISIAIGKKYNNSTSEEENARNGIEKINNYIKEIGCTNTHLGNANGLNTTPTENDNNFDIKTGYPKDDSKDGISANDLALITKMAMDEKDFRDGINNRNKEGIYYIKSGRGYFCHGVWGFNYKNKKYYIIILGLKCNSEDKNKLVDDLYKWTINELI